MFHQVLRVAANLLGPRFFGARRYLSTLGCSVGDSIHVSGRPIIIKASGSTIVFQNEVTLESNPRINYSGIVHPCTIVTESSEASIFIGEGAGISGCTICARCGVHIGKHVGIGANVSIYDNGFHPINPWERRFDNDNHILSQKVFIGDYSWIGANSVILKGVHIGKGAVIGANSVVTHDIPDHTVFAGNPAKFIREVHITEEQKEELYGKDAG